MIFDGTQKLIGTGAQAEVVLYQGYAYKIYKPSYPSEWIAFEKRQQQAVNKAGLSPVRYYDTDDDHIIKMDYVEGCQLEKIAVTGDLRSFDIMADAFRFVHGKSIEGIDMPPLIATAGMGLTDEAKSFVLPVIEDICSKMESRVCHLDMHFLNIMVPEDLSSFTLIDWMNARLAPPVFDYARTYVIFEEFSKEALEIYKEKVLPYMWDTGVSEKDFKDALEVSRIIRNREKGLQ